MNTLAWNIQNHHINKADITSFKNVRKFYLIWNSSIAFPREILLFDILECVDITGIKFNDLFDFVRKHPTIIDLSVDNTDFYESDLSAENFLQVCKALPSLESLDIQTNPIYSLDETVRLLDEVKKLEVFYFHENGIFEVSDLIKRLGEEWSSKDKFAGMIYLKRHVEQIWFGDIFL